MKFNRRKSIIGVETMVDNFLTYYVGPEFIGNYGELDDLNYHKMRYISGHTKNIFVAEAVVVVDKKARMIAENVYENGRGNVFFCNIYNRELWTRYFNKSDSKIILNYYKRVGKKPYMELKEDLINVVNEEKIKKFYNKNVHGREILIDNKKYTFNRYKDFRKIFNTTPGFGRSWAIKAGYQEAIISIHTISYYQWIEIDF